MAEQRKQGSAQQKLEIVLAGIRWDRSVRDVCREHDVSEALYYSWRDKSLEGMWSRQELFKPAAASAAAPIVPASSGQPLAA